ncbi:facilitated trehalose transporter Tret1-like [Prorops nasuta]|uniref:facilitated trehalose transporter Tret1-like n=1 Tax=Prorops nasuta TaxID=863751 RepID=UPI0034CE4048
MQAYAAAIAGNLGMLSIGLFFGWASPSLSKLQSEDSPVKLNLAQYSWIVSLFTFGALAGSVISSFIINVIGRKKTMLASTIPSIIGWLMIAFATTASEFYISRFISGISAGISYSVTPIYLGEISPAKQRGLFTSILTVAAKLGAILEYSMGPFLSVQKLALVSLIAPILFAATFVWLPESPYQLIRSMKHREAIDSLIKLRGKQDIFDEFDLIHKSVNEDLTNGTGFKELFCVPGNRKAMIIILGLLFCQQFGGSQVIINYAQSIFDAANIGFEGKYLTIILGVIQLTFTIICSATIDRGGRRLLLVSSLIGTGVATGIIGAYFYCQKLGLSSAIEWMPAIGVIMYVVTYAFGIAVIPFTLMGELFPTNVKALGNTVIMSCCNIFSFGIIKSYQDIVDAFGIYISFWIFTFFNFIGAIFSFFYVPETKGRTLQDIQNELRGRKV